MALCATQAELKAGDFEDFVSDVKDFFEEAGDRIDSCLDRVRAHINSPQVQARLEQIRAEHRAKLKEILLTLYPKVKEFRERVRPALEAQLQIKFMQLHAKMVDALKIFKAQAAARYEEELDKLISKLPPEVQDKVRELRASEDYQKRRADAARKIEDYIVENIHKSADKFREELKDYVDDKLAELDALILAKIESL